MDPITFITKFKQGDNEAFKIAFNELNGMLIGYLVNKTHKSQSEVEDAVAECWYKVFIHRERFESLDHVKWFCLRVCRNTNINLSRNYTNDQKMILDLVHILQTSELPYEEKRFEKMVPYVKDEINSLKGRRGEIIRMNLLENIKIPDIAAKLGIAIQSCYNQRSRAILAIRERLLSIEHLLFY